MATKVSFFYEYKGKGITETWINTGSASSVRDTQIKKYLDLRLAFADDDMIATYVRLSDPSAPNRVDFVALANLAGFKGKIEEDGCSPSDAILCRWLGTALEPGRTFLHCFPASFLKEDKVVPKGKWFNKFDAWKDYIISPGNGWRLNSTSGNIVANRKPITNVQFLNPRGYRIYTADVTGLNPGNVVHVGRAGGDCVGIQGRKVVQSVDNVSEAKSFVVGGVKPVGTIADGAYWVKLTLSTPSVGRGEAERLTEHKVGKPFALPAGRQASTLSLRR